MNFSSTLTILGVKSFGMPLYKGDLGMVSVGSTLTKHSPTLTNYYATLIGTTL